MEHQKWTPADIAKLTGAVIAGLALAGVLAAGFVQPFINPEVRTDIRGFVETLEVCDTNGLRDTEPACDESARALETLLNTVYNADKDASANERRTPYSRRDALKLWFFGIEAETKTEYLRGQLALDTYRAGDTSAR